MKINKLIARGLSIGFLLNSLSILSYANTEIPERYQTLEGEYITIDDSIEGNLEEIEIFGNTIQDENNLEDIQSAGDLYVDENGNPILDKQGRKQYKIDIVTTGKNLFNCDADDNVFGKGLDLNGKPLDDTSKDYMTTGFIEVKPNTTYFKSGNKIGGSYTFFYDKNKKVIGDLVRVYEGSFVTPPNTKYIRTNSRINSINTLQIEEGNNESSYERYKSFNISLLLPTQLQKVGNIADRLYWDSEKRKYIIEKNIEKIELDGTERWNVHSELENTIAVRVNNLSINPIFTRPCINDSFPTQTNEFIWDILSKDEEKMIVGGGTYEYFLIRVLKDKLETPDAEGFKKYLINNPITAYYQTSASRIIETNITSKLKVPTYEGKTHVFVETENGINPTLKVVVDRLDKIAENAIEEAENNSTSSNISLARMYVNMLPESLYKDQLQNQLSEVFSSDIVLDRKTVTSNLDLYIKCENILMMSLSTNSITFEDFSGIEDMEKANAVNITINSSLPYQLNAYLPTEIQNSDKSATMNKDILNIKENSESVYQTFANTADKIILKDNCSAGNNLVHGVDIKLKGGIAHQKDVYKTTIKFEAEQK